MDIFDVNGPHLLEVKGSDDTRVIDIKRVMMDTYAHPLYILEKDGTIYNWHNVIRIKPL